MLNFYHQGKISLEKIAEKMCHAPADIFHINKRGYIREGYWADLVIVDLKNKWKEEKLKVMRSRWVDKYLKSTKDVYDFDEVY